MQKEKRHNRQKKISHTDNVPAWIMIDSATDSRYNPEWKIRLW